VKPLYSQTAIGVIPEDWETVYLGQVCQKIGSGYTPRGADKVYKDSGIALIRSQNVLNDSFSRDGLVYIDEATAKEMQNVTVKTNDTLLNITGDSVARCCTVPDSILPARVNQHVAIIRTNNKDLNPIFLRYYLTTTKMQEFMWNLAQSGGGTRNALTKATIEQMVVPKPRMPEQIAIAKILSDIDALIGKLATLISKKMNLKRGAMQQLLTGRRRLRWFFGTSPKVPTVMNSSQEVTQSTTPGYKRTEVGIIPEDWDVAKLGDIAFVTKLAGFEYTKFFHSYKEGGEIVVIRGTNIAHNKLDLSDVRTIPRETSDKLPRSKLAKNDLVFAYVGTIGPVYLIDENSRYHLGPNTCKIRVNSMIEPQYLCAYFTSWLLRNEIVAQTSIGAQPSLSMSKIRCFRVIMPRTKEEQSDIAQVLNDMDAEIQELEKERDKYLMIKKGMMQQLFTGSIRVR
jgi:type I restriction enzyme S subunit